MGRNRPTRPKRKSVIKNRSPKTLDDRSKEQKELLCSWDKLLHELRKYWSRSSSSISLCPSSTYSFSSSGIWPEVSLNEDRRKVSKIVKDAMHLGLANGVLVRHGKLFEFQGAGHTERSCVAEDESFGDTTASEIKTWETMADPSIDQQANSADSKKAKSLSKNKALNPKS